MVNYVALAATAKRLIEANGRLVTLFKRDRDPAVAGQPWRGPDLIPTPPDGIILGPIRVAFVPASGSGFGKMLFDGETNLAVKIDQVGIMATVSAADLSVSEADIEKMDSLLDGTEVLKIVSKGHLKPADTSLIFLLGLQL